VGAGHAIAIEQSTVAGLEAQLEMFRRHHPDSPVLADSGQRFRDGKPKDLARLAFEQAFDRHLNGLRADVNPLDHRHD
jgi:hypothetical protein